MVNKPALYITGTDTSPQAEEGLNKWYDEEQIPWLVKTVDGLDAATRYRLVPITKGEYPKYLAVYEFRDRQAVEAWYTGPGVLASRARRLERWKETDFWVKWGMIYEPISTFHK